MNTKVDLFTIKKNTLLHTIKQSQHKTYRLHKKTASNLFRYFNQTCKPTGDIKIQDFDTIIHIDDKNLELNVEGMTSYEKIVKNTLKYGLLPTVTPELKHITIGGAIVGIGIESNSFQFGFVHDGLLEAEILTPTGEIVIANARNQYADLFSALPNSYGTFGYILRVKIKLYRAAPFVKLTIQCFNDHNKFLDAMYQVAQENRVNFIEGLVFSSDEMYLILGKLHHDPIPTEDIYKEIHYRLIQIKSDFNLRTEDYIFRYDPDWFWNIPETFFYKIFRKFVPKKFRNSGFYKKYIDYKQHWLNKLGYKKNPHNAHNETLIQDWEVPWKNSATLLMFALKNIDLYGKPWAIVPILPKHQPTFYPVKRELYFNLGCYSISRRTNQKDIFYNTKIMDQKCYELGGLKMLYSSTFLSKKEFDNIYNGAEYLKLKQKYDPHYLRGDLFQKISFHR